MDIKTAISYIYRNESKQRQQTTLKDTSSSRIAEAIALIRQAIQIQPNEYSHYCFLAELLAEANEIEEAIIAYREAIKLNSENPRVYDRLGQLLQTKHQFSEAINCYQQAIQLEPNNADFHCCLGEALFKANQLEAAIVTHKKAIELNPKQLLSFYYLGLIRRQQNKYREAINYLQQTIEIDPKTEQAYLALQYIPIEPEQLEELIVFYQKIIEQIPTVSLAWANLGDILTEQGKLKEAICCYQTSGYHDVVNAHPHLVNLNWQSKKEKCPDFIIIGAGKCGTSSLFKYLGQHPQILTPRKKELNFFTEENFSKGFDWYLAHFPAITDYPGFITGEASPAYFNHPLAFEKIRELLPEVKLICLLRNPVNRSISWYHHNLKCGYEFRSLEEIFEAEIEQISLLPESEIANISGYIADSIYIYILQKWFNIIPSDRIIIIQTEELEQQPDRVMTDLFDFLEIPNYPCASYQRYNESYYDLGKYFQIIKKLSAIFKPYNLELENYLNRKFNWE